MRVLLITKTLAEFAGDEGRFREISKGVRLSVLVPRRWRGRGLWAEAQKLKPQGYDLLPRDCWFSGSGSVGLRYHLHFYPGIFGVIGSGRWDLIHIDEEPFNLNTYLVLRACRKHKRPAVFTTWQNLMKRYPPPFDYFERYVYKNAEGGITCNVEALDILRRRKFRKLTVCLPQYGVNSTLFRKVDASDLRRKMGLEGAFVVGFAGRLSKEKGLDTLFKALALLPKDSALVLVGAGPDGPRLRSLARALDLSARVRWEHWVDHSEIARYMCAFDVFVLPSRSVRNWKEQFGRVLVEAMACETPVVGSDSGDIPNVVGDAGLVFHEGDERDLASCLRRLMEDSSLREALGRRGRDRALERFSCERIGKGMVDFYRRICSGGENAA